MSSLARINDGIEMQRRGWALADSIMITLSALHSGALYREEAQRLLPNNKHVLDLLTRSPTSPHTIAGLSALASNPVLDAIHLLAGQNASAAILADAINVEPRTAVPKFTASALQGGSRTGEGMPINVEQLSFDAFDVLPVHKLKVIIGMTNEVLERSTPSILAVTRALVVENMNILLDSEMLSDTAAGDDNSAGLLAGVTPITASDLSDPVRDMHADLASVVAAVSVVAGNGPVIVVTTPRMAILLKLHLSGKIDNLKIFGSTVLAEGVIVAIAPNGIAAALDPQPRFEAADQATLHMDTAAAALSIAGSPANIISAPIRNLFQTNSTAIKIVLTASWLKRSDNSVAVISGANW